MIFELLDGRNLLYQWDLNRKLAVNDNTIKEVHFCNRADDRSLVVEVVDGIANIPNCLLQQFFDIRVYGYDGEATLHEEVFKVKPRTRPSDYVYTEIEIKRYEDLEKRIDDIERNGISEEVITEAVENYLKENQIDLEGYATEEYVNEAINNIPKVDLSDYATKTYVNEEVAKAVSGGETDLSDYYTKSEVDEKVANVEVDLTGYATEEYVDNAIAEIEITGGGGSTLYRHTVTIGNVATDVKDFLDVANAVIINTSSEPFTFETLRQYLLENKLLPVSYMNVSGNTTSKMAIRLQTAESVTTASAYAGQLALYVIDTKVTSTQSVSGSYLYYPSTTPIADTVVKIGVAGGGSGEPVDLSNYYTKEEVNDLIPDTSNFITEVPSEYVTETELNAKNYLTEHQSLEDYASKDYVDEAIANAGGSGGGSTEGAVSYLEAQDLTTEQKNQAKANLDLPYTEIIPTTYFTNQSANAISSQRSAYIYASNQPSIKDLASAAIGTTFSITVKNSSSNPTLTETVECIKTTLSNYDVLTDTTNFLYLSNDSGSVTSSGMDVMKKTNTGDSGYKSTVYVDLVVDVPSGVNKLSEELIESTLLSGLLFDNSSDYQMTFVTKSKSSSYNIPNGNISIGNKNNILSGTNSYYFGYENKGVQNNYPNFIIGNNNRTGYYEYSESASGSAPAKNMFIFGSNLKPSQNTGYASVVVGSYNEKTSKYIPYDSATTYNTGDCVTARQTNYSSAVYRCLQNGVKGNSIPTNTSSNDYWEYVDNGQSSEYVFTIGNGVSGARSNAFTVDALGNVVAAGTVSPTGADYAEYFEFEDGNANNEDRMGLLVELVDGKIKLANGTDILGATSASKGVIGDAEEMNWHGKYERDELGRLVFEDVEVEREVINEETGETEIVKELITIKKISKDFDPNRTYQPRSSRKEWYPVGLLGKVLVRQDGSLSVGDYVKAINGIATKSEEKTNIRVLEVMSEGIVRVLVK